MDTTQEHYARLLGLATPWAVTRAKLNVEKLRVDIFVEYKATAGICSECGASCRIYDRSPGRTWRHLDTMQFETFLYCEPPRIECEQHGVRDFGGKHSRFTALFKAFAVRVLIASRSIQEASKLLRLNWHHLQGIMKRSVQRGLERRGNDETPWIGMDEKSFRKGHVLDQWAYENDVPLDFIEQGKPQQNGYVESFNGKFRDECLNEHWFGDVAEAREIIEDWRVDYNQVRPHSSLKYLAPAEFVARLPLGGEEGDALHPEKTNLTQKDSH